MSLWKPAGVGYTALGSPVVCSSLGHEHTTKGEPNFTTDYLECIPPARHTGCLDTAPPSMVYFQHTGPCSSEDRAAVS